MESEWTSQLFWVLRIYVEYSLLWNQFLHQLQLTLLQISTIFRTSNSDSKKWKVTIDLILICFYLMTTPSKKTKKLSRSVRIFVLYFPNTTARDYFSISITMSPMYPHIILPVRSATTGSTKIVLSQFSQYIIVIPRRYL